MGIPQKRTVPKWGGKEKNMSDHPIEGLMMTAMNSIKDMVDVDTIIGEAIQASNNTVIIPIS